MSWRDKIGGAFIKAGEALTPGPSRSPINYDALPSTPTTFKPVRVSLKPPPAPPPPPPEPTRYSFRPTGSIYAITPPAGAGAAGGEPPPPCSAPDPPTSEPDRADHLSQLFHSALTAETPAALVEFVEFCGRFRRHSIFNARLIQTQRRGARACATAKEWRATGRYVLPDAQPIIILWPFGPVAHVYDVEDTGPPYDRHAIGDPFAATAAVAPMAIAAAIDRLVKGCAAAKLFHVAIEGDRLGFGFAGSATVQGSLPLALPDDAAAAAHGRVASTLADPKRLPKKAGKAQRWVPSWRVKVNDRLTPAEQLVTIAHELGHIFCGHLGGCEGSASASGWPVRRHLGHHEQEMEAEAVAWLVARRAGVMTGSAAYLRRHVEGGKIGSVNTDIVLRAAARIETLAGLRYVR